jgi:hypothetical protein
MTPLPPPPPSVWLWPAFGPCERDCAEFLDAEAVDAELRLDALFAAAPLLRDRPLLDGALRLRVLVPLPLLLPEERELLPFVPELDVAICPLLDLLLVRFVCAATAEQAIGQAADRRPDDRRRGQRLERRRVFAERALDGNSTEKLLDRHPSLSAIEFLSIA